jgi:hypothetical protein
MHTLPNQNMHTLPSTNYHNPPSNLNKFYVDEIEKKNLNLINNNTHKNPDTLNLNTLTITPNKNFQTIKPLQNYIEVSQP